MPKRKRHQPGKYKPKPEIGPNFIGTKPLTLFLRKYSRKSMRSFSLSRKPNCSLSNCSKRRQRIASAFSIMEALNSRSLALAGCP